MKSGLLDRIIGGMPRELYRDGSFDPRQSSAALVTRTDVEEAIRDKLHATSLEMLDRYCSNGMDRSA